MASDSIVLSLFFMIGSLVMINSESPGIFLFPRWIFSIPAPVLRFFLLGSFLISVHVKCFFALG